MIKRISVLFLCFVLCLCVGCKAEKEENNAESSSNISSVEEVSSEPEPVITATNMLTGLQSENLEAMKKRPIAIMINNLSVAQKVQTGLGQADIVYETEVEGGITRLMAVFQDVSSVGQLGTIRSARYDYIDLAMGHNAVYCYHGADKVYAEAHLSDTARILVDTNNCGKRIKNGLSKEHTLYTYGDKLWDYVNQKVKKFDYPDQKPWQEFSTDEISYSNPANSVTVKFSGAAKSTFKYDAETKKYIRFANGTERKDFVSGESLYFKNVFVLLTSITDREDGLHKAIKLSSGDGYYISNGTYTPIKWKKGASDDPLVMTNVDGSTLHVNAGNSFVCIASKSYSKPTIE